MAPGFKDIKSLNDIIVEIPDDGKYRQVTWKEFIKLCKDKND